MAKTLIVDVVVNTNSAKKNINDLDKELNNVSKELADIAVNSSKSLETLSKGGAVATSQLSNLTSVSQTLGTGLGGVTQSVGGLSNAFKVLLGNPIVLVISLIAGALIGLVNAFKKTDEGATFFEGAMKGLAAIGDIVTGIFLKFGKVIMDAIDNPKQAIIDLGNLIKENIINRFKAFQVIGEALGKLMKGDFNAGLKQLADGAIQVGTGITNATDKIKNFSSEIAKAVKEGMELAKLFDNLADRQRDFSVQAAKNENEITRLLIASKDRTKDLQERLKLLDQASKIEQANNNQLIKFANENLALIKKENEGIIEKRRLKEVNATLSDEEAQKAVDAELKIQKLKGDSIVLQEKITNRRLALLEAEETALKASIEKQTKAEEEKYKEQLDIVKKYQADLAKLQDDRNKELQAENDAETARLEAETQKGFDKLVANKEAKKELERQFEQAKIDIAAEAGTAALQALQQRADAEAQIELKALEEKKANIDDRLTYETDRLQASVDAGLLSEQDSAQRRRVLEQTAQKDKEALDRQQGEIQRKAFNRQKAFQIGVIALNLAAELAAISANAAANPSNAVTFGLAGVSQAAILSGVAIAKSAIQAGLVAAQQPPAFAQGGFVSGAGNGTSDSILARLSNGEFVVNADSTSAFAPVLQAINSMGQSQTLSGVNTSTINQTNGNSQPQRAFVVESDISQKQRDINKIITRNTFSK